MYFPLSPHSFPCPHLLQLDPLINNSLNMIDMICRPTLSSPIHYHLIIPRGKEGLISGIGASTA